MINSRHTNRETSQCGREKCSQQWRKEGRVWGLWALEVRDELAVTFHDTLLGSRAWRLVAEETFQLEQTELEGVQSSLPGVLADLTLAATFLWKTQCLCLHKCHSRSRMRQWLFVWTVMSCCCPILNLPLSETPRVVGLLLFSGIAIKSSCPYSLPLKLLLLNLNVGVLVSLPC